jgi:hypothetical protein
MSAVVAAVRGGDGVEGTAGAADRTQIDAVEQTAAHVGEQAGMLADRATAVLCVTSVMGTQLGAVRERATAVATAAADTTRHSRAAAAAAAEIRALVEGARTGVDTLAAHARDIEATSAALDRLALESRLVALNAAVQAAHAGAAGAGFAVVADKVRELADGASVASAQIIARLSAIRDRAVHAASVMTSVSGRVEGIDAFTAAVAHAAAHQEAGTAEITEAIAEAERSVGEVVRAVEDIAEVGMTLSDDAERGLAAARALREMAEAAGGEDGRDEGTGDEDAADGVAADDRAGTDRVAYDGAGTDRAGDDRAGTIPPEARGPATRGPATRGPSSGTPNARRRAAVRAARRHGVGRAGARPPRGAAGAPAGAVDLGGPVTPGDLYAVALGTRPAVVGHAARARMDASAAYLARCVAERRLVYGVTTGYGPLARHHVGPEHAPALQRNLVYHLATGVGAPLSTLHTRALMATRLASLARGRSGVGPAIVELLLGCLARGVTPVVPERGTVGASGDLTPLAHIALVLIGGGARDPRRTPSTPAPTRSGPPASRRSRSGTRRGWRWSRHGRR